VSEMIVSHHTDSLPGEIFSKTVIPPDKFYHPVSNLQDGPASALRRPFHGMYACFPVLREILKILRLHLTAPPVRFPVDFCCYYPSAAVFVRFFLLPAAAVLVSGKQPETASASPAARFCGISANSVLYLSMFLSIIAKLFWTSVHYFSLEGYKLLGGQSEVFNSQVHSSCHPVFALK
jgi:hypothetical protein